MNFNKKVILITGASSGIGLELARQLATYNCKLVLAARRESLLEEIEKELKQINKDIISVKCDVSIREEVKDAVKTAINSFGRIDIAILNAGINVKSKLNEPDSKAMEKIFDVNVIGMSYFFEDLIPVFKDRGGMFVGVSSLADVRGFPLSGFYNASKAAATLFLESQRIELKPLNIKVLTVKPGFVKTPMTDKNKFKMPFLMDVEKATKIILKGIEKEKIIIQFPWQTVWGAKFLRILPNSIFDLLADKHRKSYQPESR
ncbi:MAG: SDR family NAD(P)-dependent oxidoreductase [Ignavibacteriaceae bacterium]|jgi:short-subunit dehydrogenase